MSKRDLALIPLEFVQLISGMQSRLLERLSEPMQWTGVKSVDALELHQAVKSMARLTRDIVDEVDQLLIASMEGERRAEISGKVVEVRRAYKRYDWDHDLLAGRLRERALESERVDPDSGEVLPEGYVVTRALLAAARPEWRVTVLRDRFGIEADNYCSRELNRATVAVIGGDR